MSSRISSLALLLVVTACGAPRVAVPGEHIDCAIDGAAAFAKTCTTERTGNQIVVHRPDGGFSRFEVVSDGGVAALDGADPVREVVLGNGLVEVQVRRDRYRLRIEAPGSAPER